MDQYAFRPRLEHLLHPWVAFLVLPVFALFNASVSLSGGGAMLSPVTTGVFLGSQPTTQLTSSPSTSKIVAFYNPAGFIVEEDEAWR